MLRVRVEIPSTLEVERLKFNSYSLLRTESQVHLAPPREGRDCRRPDPQLDPTRKMAITTYLLAVNALAFTMHAEDKLAAAGWLPMFGRIPGRTVRQVCVRHS